MRPKDVAETRFTPTYLFFLEGLIGVRYFEQEKNRKYYHRILQKQDFHQFIWVFRWTERCHTLNKRIENRAF